MIPPLHRENKKNQSRTRNEEEREELQTISPTDRNVKTLANKLGALDPLEIIVRTILHQIKNIMDKPGHPLNPGVFKV